MKIARVFFCQVATIFRTEIPTNMKICFTPHENVVKVAVVQIPEQNITVFLFTLS
jgi:hypothetical protein